MMSCITAIRIDLYYFPRAGKNVPYANSFCSQTYENSLKRQSPALPKRSESERSQSEGKGNERSTFRLWKRAASEAKVIQLVDPEYAK